jgi:hypothetical protein
MKLIFALFLHSQVAGTLNEYSCDYYKVPLTTTYGSQNMLKCSANNFGKCLCQIYKASKEWVDCLSEPVDLLVSL